MMFERSNTTHFSPERMAWVRALGACLNVQTRQQARDLFERSNRLAPTQMPGTFPAAVKAACVNVQTFFINGDVFERSNTIHFSLDRMDWVQALDACLNVQTRQQARELFERSNITPQPPGPPRHDQFPPTPNPAPSGVRCFWGSVFWSFAMS